MKKPFIALLLFALPCVGVKAQYAFLKAAPAGSRLAVFWRHCSDQLISDKDSVVTCRFLDGAARVADSLGDPALKKYAFYFRRCFRLLFSLNYQQYFAKDDYLSPAAIFTRTKTWAIQNGYTDIAAACEHNLGEVYFYAGRYGPAFEHLLNADADFRELGYANIPGIAIYLYDLGLNYYRFEERDKALTFFLEAARHPSYLPWVELSTLNAIGLIHAKKKEWDKATACYRTAVARADGYGDATWVGIASGNLGNAFLENGENDSALFYHRKNYGINTAARAPIDAALSALAIATVFMRRGQDDSAQHYIELSQGIARRNKASLASDLGYQQRLLLAMIERAKARGDYKAALGLTDSLLTVKDSARSLLDGKIVNRAVARSEADRYEAARKLLESQKDLERVRFYALAAMALSGLVIAALVFNRYRLRKRREALLAQKQKELLSIEKLRAEENLRHAEEQLTTYVTAMREKTDLVENLVTELEGLKEEGQNDTNHQTLAANMEKLLAATILTDDDWRHFRSLFEQVHPGFVDRLLESFPDLSPAETRLLILTKLNLSSREMANMLGISAETIRKSRYRLRKRLNLEEGSNLTELVYRV